MQEKAASAVVEMRRDGETHCISERARGIMRGTIAGKKHVLLDATPELNPSEEPAFEISQSGSHTLRSRDFEDARDLRARLIEATVEAFGEGSGPRLSQSRL